MEEIIRHQDRYYIRATSSRVDTVTRVLKHGDTFALFDRYGDALPVGSGEQGVYHMGMRHLSREDLLVQGTRPLLLSSTVTDDNLFFTADLTNPDLAPPSGEPIPRGTLHIFRSKLLWNAVCYQHIRVRNYGRDAVCVDLRLDLDADFADIFEVRGVERKQRGIKTSHVEDGMLLFRYRGLDGLERTSRFRMQPGPDSVAPEGFRARLRLAPGAVEDLWITGAFQSGGMPPPRAERFRHALDEARSHARAFEAATCRIRSGNPHFDRWVGRSLSDLHMLVSETPAGPYPYAGVPWYSTPFGRDGLWTALMTLWLRPDLARGVLAYLASTQAREADPDRDAEPGKILHEAREGEMANLGEIPFKRYYGSVDATPLFVALAGLYLRRTGDREFVLNDLWPHLMAACRWMDAYGDPDADGLIEYQRKGPRGLVNQGWKDSHDAVFHEDGALADGPIALVEVQGYAYLARMQMAALARARGEDALADEQDRKARKLAEEVDRRFWMEGHGTYALALDGAKRPCAVRSSNPGHLLLAGLPGPGRARRTVQSLLDAGSFSGWGIRTVAEGAARYNPMAYHNGSVWPHDNAIIAFGLARYGFVDAVEKVFRAMYEASLHMDLSRLPELFCGFARRPSEGPTLYPVACSPQAWSSAVPFFLLQASLGMRIQADPPMLRFLRPRLPDFLDRVVLEDLAVGDERVDVAVTRYDHDAAVTILRRSGPVDVMVVNPGTP